MQLILIYNRYKEPYYILYKMNNLILVRHGQSLWNKERRFTGWADIDLTEQGKSEAKEAGKLIKELKIEFHSYFTSRLKRATESLEIILEILNKKNVEIIKTAALNERHYGGLTSLNKDDIIKKYGSKKVQVWRRSFDIHPPPYYNEKIKPLISEKKNILIVFHGNSCRALLMKILNISKEKITKFEIPTGNPLLIKFADDLKIEDCKYLDSKRAKKILFNV